MHVDLHPNWVVTNLHSTPAHITLGFPLERVLDSNGNEVRMKRAAVLSVFVLIVLLANAVVVEAQQAGKVARIGRLSPISPSVDAQILGEFRKGLHGLGWVEGKNVFFEYRFAEGQFNRLPTLASQLVELKVDVILAGSIPGALAAKNATGKIPIVMVTTGDPVKSGLVASLAQPGGNVTGVTALLEVLSGKRLELLKEVAPSLTRVGVLSTPAYPFTGELLREVEGVAQALGVKLRIFELRNPGEFEPTFVTISSEKIEGLLVGTDPMYFTHRKRIVELANKSRIPTMYGLGQYMETGGLMFYGASLPYLYRQAATFADKILKGRKPSDLPVEQAKQIGLTIPPTVLARADRVIR